MTLILKSEAQTLKVQTSGVMESMWSLLDRELSSLQANYHLVSLS